MEPPHFSWVWMVMRLFTLMTDVFEFPKKERKVTVESQSFFSQFFPTFFVLQLEGLSFYDTHNLFGMFGTITVDNDNTKSGFVYFFVLSRLFFNVPLYRSRHVPPLSNTYRNDIQPPNPFFIEYTPIFSGL